MACGQIHYYGLPRSSSLYKIYRIVPQRVVYES